MISTFTESLLAKREVLLKDGGRFRSDLVYVEDVANAAIEATVRDVNGIFNVGSGATASALEIANAIVKLTATDPGLVRIEPPNDDVVPLGFSPLNIERARAELDYRPLALDAALSRYVDWHRSARKA
jgi:UDP-glucose 4-epimerase